MSATIDDVLYTVGDRIGWDRCDYARDSQGFPYGLTDGRATLAITMAADVACWSTYVATPDGPDLLDGGECPATSTEALVHAWRDADAIALPHEERVVRTVARLAEEGWTHEQDGDTHILRSGHATVTIAPDGEVISDDPMARLYVHAGYAPEDYGIFPTA